MTGRLVALLVGIDAYPAPLEPLRGCVNDVRALGAVLRDRVPQDTLALRVLTDAEATRDATIRAITEHLGTAGADDVALLYFSGHGSQADAPPELWPTEPDHLLETLVLVDSREPDGWDLADTEVASLLGGVAASGAQVVTILDCCHSGSGTRSAGVRARLAPTDHRVRPLTSFVAAGAPRAGVVRSLGPAWATGAGSQVLLAACRSSEVAQEADVRGRPRGALSSALEEALRRGGPLTHRQLHRRVSAAVQDRVDGQHPQLEATRPADLDAPFLGGTLTPAPARLLVSHLPEGWCVDAGAVHGIPDPLGDDCTELAIRGLDAAASEPPLATATVTRVLPDRSLLAVTGTLAPDEVYRAVVTSIPLPPLTFAVTGEGTDAAAVRTAAATADATLIRLVADEQGADALVHATGAGFTVTRPGVVRPVVPVLASPDRVTRTIVALEHVARWLRLAGLHNPLTALPADAVDVRLETPDGRSDVDGRLEVAYAGTTAPPFAVWLTNAFEGPLWCALVDLTDAYGIYPDALPAGSVALAPGESTRVDLVGQVPDELVAQGVHRVTDRLKLVVSTLEFDPRPLQQDDLDVGASAPEATRGAGAGAGAGLTTLDRLFARVRTRAAAAPAAPVVADWRADDYVVVTTR